MKTLLFNIAVIPGLLCGSLFAQNSPSPPASNEVETITKDQFGGEIRTRPGGYTYTPESKYLTPPPSPYGTPPYGNPGIILSPLSPIVPMSPLQPLLQQERLPQSLQGAWYETSANNTYIAYVFRGTDYDTYEIDPITSQLVIAQNGQPVRLMRDQLVYTNNRLTLSPGNNTQGPFVVTDAPAPLPQGIILAPLRGTESHYLTRKPQPLPGQNGQGGRLWNGPPGRGRVMGRNVKMVTFTVGPSTAIFYESAQGLWIESNPQGQTIYQELNRDKWSVFLQDRKSGSVVQLDLNRKVIGLNGQDTFNIDEAY
ncbi:hypothetical protein Pla110_45870 [Polystyrenella longa]|uniref:SLA1 homology domain-containing protein n=1 Tax=Polystyrenella longa TaxID=2528007 RepID=A0A518CUF8_9PLAN|nr:hypothetical protein [Polystyrenella longa]QDU82824.1 hypothetical protein Pla110_45870 [Polystyrenella longa]